MTRIRLACALMLGTPACAPASPGDVEGATTETGASSSSTSEVSTTSTETGNDWGAPDCEDLMLPGDPDDVAATPRADRDAEILALELAPERFVARTVDYEIVADDLAAIRAIAPELGDVHIDCRVPPGYAFWLFEDIEVVEAVWVGTFQAWDCHNAFYGIEHRPAGQGGDVGRIDGYAFAMVVDGVYAAQFAELYAQIPGLETADVTAFWGGYFDYDCEEPDGTITLDATIDGAGTLDERTYRFEHPELGTVTYLVTPGAAPMQVG